MHNNNHCIVLVLVFIFLVAYEHFNQVDVIPYTAILVHCYSPTLWSQLTVWWNNQITARRRIELLNDPQPAYWNITQVLLLQFTWFQMLPVLFACSNWVFTTTLLYSLYSYVHCYLLPHHELSWQCGGAPKELKSNATKWLTACLKFF